jgi:hypothetical protein
MRTMSIAVWSDTRLPKLMETGQERALDPNPPLSAVRRRQAGRLQVVLMTGPL